MGVGFVFVCLWGGHRNLPFSGGSALGGTSGREREGVACLLCVGKDMSQSYKLTGD